MLAEGDEHSELIGSQSLIGQRAAREKLAQAFYCEMYCDERICMLQKELVLVVMVLMVGSIVCVCVCVCVCVRECVPLNQVQFSMCRVRLLVQNLNSQTRPNDAARRGRFSSHSF